MNLVKAEDCHGSQVAASEYKETISNLQPVSAAYELEHQEIGETLV